MGDHYLKSALSTIGYPKHFIGIMDKVGITNIQTLLNKHPSFAVAGPVDQAGVKELLATLHAVDPGMNEAGAASEAWPVDGENETTNCAQFVNLVIECRLQRAAASAHAARKATAAAEEELPKTVAPPTATSTTTGATADTEARKQHQIALAQYTFWEIVYSTKTSSDERIANSIIAKEFENFREGHRIHNNALGSITLQRDVRPVKTTTDFLGDVVTKTKHEAAEVEITNKEIALEQLRRQCEGWSIAGTFDPAGLKDDARPPIRCKQEESKVTYIASIDGQRTVVEKDLFATREGMLIKYTAIKQVADQYNLGAVGIVALSTQVDKAFWDAILRGHTADSAMRKAVIEDHHNVAAHHGVDAEARGQSSQATTTAGATPATTSTKAAGKRSVDRSTDEQMAAKERHILNQQAQIENLKKGRGKGSGGWNQGGGKGGGRGNPSWVPQGWNYVGPPQPQFYPQYGKGMGKGAGWQQGGYQQQQMTPPQVRPRFADHVCADFNLRACATPCPNGRQHVCGNCGGQHPWKACPTK